MRDHLPDSTPPADDQSPVTAGRELLVRGGLALAAIALATCVTSGLVLASASESKADLNDFASSTLAQRDVLTATQSDFYAYDDQLNMWVLVARTAPKNTTLITDTRNQALEARARLVNDLKQAAATAPDQEQRDLVASLSKGYDAYEGFATTTSKAVAAGDLQTAARAITVDNADASNALMDGLKKATERDTVVTHAAQENLQSEEGTVVRWSIVALVTIPSLLALLFVPLRRSVVQPLRNIVRVLRAMAGDLRATVATFRY